MIDTLKRRTNALAGIANQTEWREGTSGSNNLA